MNAKVEKDTRYKAIKSLIESKSVTSLTTIFEIVPKTVVKQEMKIHYNTLKARVDNPEALTAKNIIAMATLFEVDPVEIFRLALLDIEAAHKRKKK